jgi:hypothetical protein
MACRQWNPCSPCTTLVPYPCSVPCCTQQSPSGPTGQNGPKSWVTAQISYINNTQLLPATQTPLVNINSVVDGNKDGKFQTANSTYTVPVTGVYSIEFKGGVIAGAQGAGTITIGINVNSQQKAVQTINTATLAAGNTIPVSLSTTLLLTQNQPVQITASATGTGTGLSWAWQSAVAPAVSPTTLTVTSLF